MAEHPTTDQLTNKAVDFQATAEAYYSIAVEKVKDVRYVAGFVSIFLLALTAGTTEMSITQKTSSCYLGT